jgi:hypothetical protein
VPDAAKAVLLDKIMESMTIQADRDVLNEGIKIAQTRLAEIENSTVKTIPGDIAIAQVRHDPTYWQN